MIGDYIAATILLLGACFMLVASIGIVRLPDLYLRMHAALKASTLGMLLLLLGLSIHLAELTIMVKSVLIMLFIFMTAPVASHLIGRVAHLMKIKKWKNTHRDDLEADE